jgi:hypothetical protein
MDHNIFYIRWLGRALADHCLKSKNLLGRETDQKAREHKVDSDVLQNQVIVNDKGV